MRKTLLATIVGAGLFGAYWAGVNKAVRQGATNGLSDLRAAGWNVTYSDLATGGFPSKFGINLQDFGISDPKLEVTWSASSLSASFPSLAPNTLNLSFAPEQVIDFAGQSFGIHSDDLKASARVGMSLSAPLRHLKLASGQMTLASDAGWSVDVGDMQASVEAGETASYDVAATLGSLTLPEPVRLRLDPSRTMPPEIASFALVSTVALDRVIDRSLTEAPNPTALQLESLTLVWDSVVVSASGDLTIDQAGVPTGLITLELTDWQTLLGLLADGGAITAEARQTLTNLGDGMAAGGPTLKLPVVFSGGQISVAFVPLGPAPVLRF